MIPGITFISTFFVISGGKLKLNASNETNKSFTSHSQKYANISTIFIFCLRSYMVLIDYFAYLNRGSMNNEIKDKNINALLSIKISDYDWYPKWTVPDPNSNMLIFQKI